MIRTKTLAEFFSEGNSFLELLPYYSHENGVFALKDASLGQIWEISLIQSETKSESYLEQLSQMIEGILVRLPEELISCQFILSCDEDISERLERYLGACTGVETEIASACSRSKVEHLKNGKDGFFEQHTGKFRTKSIRCFFVMRYFPPWKDTGMKDKLQFYFAGKNILKEKLSENFFLNCQNISRFSEVVEGAFKACEIKYTRICEESLFKFLYKLLNPKRAKALPAPFFRKAEPLEDQLLYNSPKAG